jgi:transcriptional regulator with XRE-family HTH domain
MTEITTPAQLRAGRALLGWTQRQLARAARVGLSTVQDAEIGKRDPITSNIEAIRRTLESGGVTFVAGNGGGPGVRLTENRPQIIRRPVEIKIDNTLAFLIVWKDRKFAVQIEKSILQQLDGEKHMEHLEYLASFRRHEQRILAKTVEAIEKNRTAPEAVIELRKEDFA